MFSPKSMSAIRLLWSFSLRLSFLKNTTHGNPSPKRVSVPCRLMSYQYNLREYKLFGPLIQFSYQYVPHKVQLSSLYFCPCHSQFLSSCSQHLFPLWELDCQVTNSELQDYLQLCFFLDQHGMDVSR